MRKQVIQFLRWAFPTRATVFDLRETIRAQVQTEQTLVLRVRDLERQLDSKQLEIRALVRVNGENAAHTRLVEVKFVHQNLRLNAALALLKGHPVHPELCAAVGDIIGTARGQLTAGN